MRRERKNEEQPIQPHVRTNNENNLVEEETYEGYVDNIEEIHMLQGEKNTMHLTQYDYEYSLNNRKQIPKNESSIKVLSYVRYRMFVDALQAEMHKKYDLKPRQKVANQDNQSHPRKPSSSLSINKFKELISIPRLKKLVILQR